jgi:hypothetical protein
MRKDRAAKSETPLHLWDFLAIVEHAVILTFEAKSKSRDEVLDKLLLAPINANRKHELMLARAAVERVIEAAEEARMMAANFIQGKYEAAVRRYSPNTRSEKVSAIIEAAKSGSRPAASSGEPQALVENKISDARWALRQALALTETVLSHSRFPEQTPRHLVYARLHVRTEYQRHSIYDFFRNVVLGGGLILERLDELAKGAEACS